jgi:hypothetical protein
MDRLELMGIQRCHRPLDLIGREFRAHACRLSRKEVRALSAYRAVLGKDLFPLITTGILILSSTPLERFPVELTTAKW